MSVDDDRPPGDRPEAPSEGESDLLKNVQQKAADIANRWLEDRFGLRREADGKLNLDETAWLKDLSERADQFVRGFFRGFLAKPSDEPGGQVTMAGMTDVMQRLLARTGQTVSHAFQDYLRENAVDREHPKEPVVLDGRFVMRHGGPLIGRIVQALGSSLGGAGAAADEPGVPHAGGAPEEKVEVKVELPELFKTLLTGRAAPTTDEPPKPTSGDAPQRDPEDPT